MEGNGLPNLAIYLQSWEETACLPVSSMFLLESWEQMRTLVSVTEGYFVARFPRIEQDTIEMIRYCLT